MAHLVLVPDVTDPPPQHHIELFAGAKDVNSVNECAELLGVCPMTIRRLIARGELDSVHIGTRVKVTKSALVNFITKQEVRA